jgi:hypothetical protein
MNIDEIAAAVGMTTKEIADVLDKAADELLIRGNIKGAMIRTPGHFGYDKEQGKVCLLGAIAAALGMTDVEISSAQAKVAQSEVVTMLKAYMVTEGITVSNGAGDESALLFNPRFGMRMWTPAKNYDPNPIRFNDHCDTKPEEVIDLLRHASKWMREIDGNE